MHSSIDQTQVRKEPMSLQICQYKLSKLKRKQKKRMKKMERISKNSEIITIGKIYVQWEYQKEKKEKEQIDRE